MCIVGSRTAVRAVPVERISPHGGSATQRNTRNHVIRILTQRNTPLVTPRVRPTLRSRQPIRLRPTRKQTQSQKIAPRTHLGFLTGKPEETKRPAREERQTRTTESASSERPARERQSRSERPTGMRTPEVVEVTSPRLYVGNLSFDAGESDLFDLFNGVGSVQNVEIVVNRHNMRSKGFAFVQMQSVDEAKRAVSDLHDKEFMGRKLVVSGAKALEERRSERTAAPAAELHKHPSPRGPVRSS